MDGVGHGLLFSLVTIDETDGFWSALTTEDNLEESIGYPYLVAADGLLLTTRREQRTTDDVDGTLLAGPVATELFEVVPLVFVQPVVLWTNVREEERLRHSQLVPLVIACWTHVAAVVTRVIVVVVGSALALRNILVFREHLFLTLNAAMGVGCRQVPRHPVRSLCGSIIRRRITSTVQNLLRSVVQRSGNFEESDDLCLLPIRFRLSLLSRIGLRSII